ncbi:2-hydroxyisoflavanone dehydratase-like [Andrographis paniculata]|uniref:2-hydroxyisoflavanone dehydratase-like n=1 Tax=Andrographis paniculata TaxID=175694 RepID=UPI0021E9668B|nr:2-hydroxyisoflavanone dehydratase-like [Andrographis paniculata]
MISYKIKTCNTASKAATQTATDILHDVFPFVRVYKNGTIIRYLPEELVPPSTDPTARVRSKDVTIDHHRNISARIFVPENLKLRQNLPILVYYHGGGFTTGSAFSKTYNTYLTSLVSKAKIVAVSVNYRLAPEHDLPIGYDDAWYALKWVFSHSRSLGGNGSEPWLRKNVDFGKGFVGGDSAGGNIAHNVVLRAGLEKKSGIVLKGLFLNCPNFWGSTRIGEEEKKPFEVVFRNRLWLLVHPNVPATFDYPATNPSLDPNIHKLGCKNLLVYVAGEDILRDRGELYVDTLNKSAWGGSIRFFDIPGEGHVFDIANPDTDNARKMLHEVALFITEDNA